MPVRRFDSAQITKAMRLDNGWLRAPATLTRTGIFEYRQADGTVRRELRRPEEVFRADSIESFEGVPFVVLHPTDVSADGLLDADTAKLKQAGAVSSPHRNGDLLDAKILITDRDAVAEVDAGKVELSGGYRCDLDETPGVYKGQPYDAEQKNIVGNHVALVDRARAGPGARIRLDNGDAEQVVSYTEQSAKPPIKPFVEPVPMKKIRIDGVEYEVSDQVAQALEKALSDRASRLDVADKSAEALKAEKSKAEARADAADAKVKDLQAKLDAATDPKIVAELVKSRAALEARAREILGSEAKLDGTDDEIKRAVLAKVLPDVKLDGKDAPYLAAAFDLAAVSAKIVKPPVTVRYDGLVRTDSAPLDIDKSQAAYNAALRDAHKIKPSTEQA